MKTNKLIKDKSKLATIYFSKKDYPNLTSEQLIDVMKNILSGLGLKL